MSAEEFKELSTIPLGHRIQWYNMLAQMAMPTVDFKKEETVLTFLQCIDQAGPRIDETAVARATHSDLIAELSNAGHRNWDPMDFPESLLIEVESGIMVRDVQEYIAAQMQSPPNGDNAVMQLNMGEGKSSVIVPITAAADGDNAVMQLNMGEGKSSVIVPITAAADGDNAVMQLNMGEGKSSVIVPITAAALAGSTGDRLARVIVAKPQSKQMQQMLISKLRGYSQSPHPLHALFTVSEAQRSARYCRTVWWVEASYSFSLSTYSPSNSWLWSADFSYYDDDDGVVNPYAAPQTPATTTTTTALSTMRRPRLQLLRRGRWR